MSDEKKIATPDPNTAVELNPVDSSQITAIGHNAAASVLAIRFKGWGGKPGSLYFYGNFGADQFQQFQKAESKGAFFGANIKNNVARHPFVKIVESKDAPA